MHDPVLEPKKLLVKKDFKKVSKQQGVPNLDHKYVKLVIINDILFLVLLGMFLYRYF